MFYGLAHNDDAILADKLTEILALAPCFVLDINSPINAVDTYLDYIIADTVMDEVGIDHISRYGNGVSEKTMKHYEQTAFTSRF